MLDGPPSPGLGPCILAGAPPILHPGVRSPGRSSGRPPGQVAGLVPPSFPVRVLSSVFAQIGSADTRLQDSLPVRIPQAHRPSRVSFLFSREQPLLAHAKRSLLFPMPGEIGPPSTARAHPGHQRTYTHRQEKIKPFLNWWLVLPSLSWDVCRPYPCSRCLP